MSAPGRPTTESNEVARHIARMAARLFAERGYEATSVREIVEAAGVAKPTLYYYFGSKEGLAKALIADPVDDLVERLRRAVEEEPDPLRSLERVLEAHFAFCREDPLPDAVSARPALRATRFGHGKPVEVRRDEADRLDPGRDHAVRRGRDHRRGSR